MTVHEPIACGLSRNDIEAIAEEVAQHFGYHPGGSLRAFVERLGGTLAYETDASFDASGSILMKPDRFKIGLPHHTGPLRDRFTIAHELGHLFLHYFGFGYHENEVTMVAQRYGSGQIETEANWFAAAFLMPAQLFRETWRRHNGNSHLVAEYFRVSEAAASVRASALRLVS